MKLAEISFKPIAHVTFTSAEIRLMCECSRCHYDGVCKDASKVGGFLYGMSNAEENAPGHSHSLTWRQLDTLAKILELGSMLELEKAKTAFGLNLEIRRTFHTLSESTPETITL